MQPGEVQRWRLVDAGVEETVLFKIVGPGEKPVPQQLIAQSSDFAFLSDLKKQYPRAKP